MGNALVNTFSGQLKSRSDGFYGSVEESESSATFSLVTTISDEDTLSYVDGSNTVTWAKPTLQGNGTAIPASTITGYKVYKKTVGSDEFYAVATTYSGGQSPLGNVVMASHWLDTLPAPDATNTVDATDSVAAIQAALAALTAGDVLYIDGSQGTINFTTTGIGSAGYFLDCSQDGTSSDYIYLIGINSPVIAGVGWADEAVGPSGNQVLIDVGGNYWRVHGFEIQDSGQMGVNLHGQYNEMYEVNAHSNWLHGIVYGNDNGEGIHAENITIKYCKSHHNRTGSGFAHILETNVNSRCDNANISCNIAYRNGFNDDNTMNPYLGGNSDGFVGTKESHDAFLPGGDLDPVTEGRYNRTRNLTLGKNISFWNADDGYDHSVGLDSVGMGNFAVENGPSGKKGFKILRNLYEDTSWVCNAAISTTANIFGNVIYYKDLEGGQSFSVSDVITGSISGATATVDSVTTSTNVSDEGILEVSSVSGTFQTDDDLLVSSVKIAEVMGLGQTLGFEGRVNSSEPTRPYPVLNQIGFTGINHDLPGALANRGISTPAGHVTTSPDMGNLLSWNNKSVDNTGGVTPLSSLLNNGGVTPGIENLTAYTLSESFTGSTIEEQWRNAYLALQAHIMPVSGGNCHNAGTGGAYINVYYHLTAADDATTPSDPDDMTKAPWTGSAPDIGAVPYVYLRPPIISSVA